MIFMLESRGEEGRGSGHPPPPPSPWKENLQSKINQNRPRTPIPFFLLPPREKMNPLM